MNRELDKQILVGSGSGANFNGAVNAAGNAETYSGSMAIADLIGAITKVQADGINVTLTQGRLAGNSRVHFMEGLLHPL